MEFENGQDGIAQKNEVILIFSFCEDFQKKEFLLQA